MTEANISSENINQDLTQLTLSNDISTNITKIQFSSSISIILDEINEIDVDPGGYFTETDESIEIIPFIDGIIDDDNDDILSIITFLYIDSSEIFKE